MRNGFFVNKGELHRSYVSDAGILTLHNEYTVVVPDKEWLSIRLKTKR
jgi:hypothetical protein